MKKKKEILVIEDIERTIKNTILELSSFGYSVDRVDNVKLAIESLNSNPFDFIIIDWRLPLEEGKSVSDEAGAIILDELRNKNSPNYNVPFIIMTAENLVIDKKLVEEMENCFGIYFKLTAIDIADFIHEKLIGGNDNE